MHTQALNINKHMNMSIKDSLGHDTYTAGDITRPILLYLQNVALSSTFTISKLDLQAQRHNTKKHIYFILFSQQGDNIHKGFCSPSQHCCINEK